jgi:hypothetical protein
MGKDMKSGMSKSSGAAPPPAQAADDKTVVDEEPAEDESPMFRVVKLEFRPTKDQGQIVHMAGGAPSPPLTESIRRLTFASSCAW